MDTGRGCAEAEGLLSEWSKACELPRGSRSHLAAPLARGQAILHALRGPCCNTSFCIGEQGQAIGTHFRLAQTGTIILGLLFQISLSFPALCPLSHSLVPSSPPRGGRGKFCVDLFPWEDVRRHGTKGCWLVLSFLFSSCLWSPGAHCPCGPRCCERVNGC